MKEFKEFVFLRHFWILDLLTVIAFALFFGYWGQVTADSGEKRTDKIVISILTTSTSYLFAYILTFILKRKSERSYSWAWIAVIGSVTYALGKHVLDLAEDWKYKQVYYSSFYEYLEETWLPHLGMEIDVTILLSAFCFILLVVFMLGMRLFVYLCWLALRQLRGGLRYRLR